MSCPVPCLLQAVREGSWWTRVETDSQLCELDAASSLQQLAASVMGEDDAPEDPALLDEPADSPTAAATLAEEAEQQQELEGGEEEGQQQQGPVRAPPLVEGFASTEEQQQYLELEREVAEMQKMLEEATAAAERGQQSHSDQQYLSEILGECYEAGTALSRVQTQPAERLERLACIS